MRPWAWGDVWDRMSPKERRFVFITDLIVGIGGAILMYLVSSWLLSSTAQAKEVLPGPIPALVERVYDGDTFTARAHIWLGQTVKVSIRLNGIDTPELRGKCAHEKTLAIRAKNRAIKLLKKEPVLLFSVTRGKYAGRAVATVTAGGVDVVEALIDGGFGRIYTGGKREPWC